MWVHRASGYGVPRTHFSTKDVTRTLRLWSSSHKRRARTRETGLSGWQPQEAHPEAAAVRLQVRREPSEHSRAAAACARAATQALSGSLCGLRGGPVPLRFSKRRCSLQTQPGVRAAASRSHPREPASPEARRTALHLPPGPRRPFPVPSAPRGCIRAGGRAHVERRARSESGARRRCSLPPGQGWARSPGAPRCPPALAPSTGAGRLLRWGPGREAGRTLT